MGREARFYVWVGVAYAIVLEALLVAAVLFWPDFEDNVDSLRDMAPIEALRGMIDQIEAGGVAAYVNGQHFFKGCNAVGSLAAIVLGAWAVAGEAQRGTLEIWIARPVSRTRLLMERWIGGAVAVVLPVYLTTLTIPSLLERVDAEMALGPLMLSATHQSLLLVAVYSVAFLWSCLDSRPLLIAFALLLVALLQICAYMIHVITHWSLFRLSDIEVHARIGAAHALDPWTCVPLAAISAILAAASIAVFARRVP